jgi:hypothetical protein
MTFPALTIAVLLLVTAFAFLFYRLASRFEPEANSAEWLDDFSLESYAPMARLFDRNDFEFLAKHAGYDPDIARRMRIERRKVFAGYLGLLIRDFNQLVHIGRLMLIQSSVDRPEFARALWRQQIWFYIAVCAIHCKLALYPLGLQVDGRRLLDSVASIFHQVQEVARERAEVY